MLFIAEMETMKTTTGDTSRFVCKVVFYMIQSYIIKKCPRGEGPSFLIITKLRLIPFDMLLAILV